MDRQYAHELIHRSTRYFQTVHLFDIDWDYFILNFRKSPTKDREEVTFMMLDILRSFRKGEDIPSIAKRLHISPEKVRSRIYRAIDIMNERVKQTPQYKLTELLEI